MGEWLYDMGYIIGIYKRAYGAFWIGIKASLELYNTKQKGVPIKLGRVEIPEVYGAICNSNERCI